MSDQNVQQPPIDITVDAATAFGLRVQEFDKVIAEGEARVADLKRQKATYIYDTNLQAVLAKSQQQPAAPSDSPATPAVAPEPPAQE